MALKWQDVQDIALALLEQYPEEDVQYIRFTDLHAKICGLAEFDDHPDKSNERILEAIQMAWLDELT